MTRSSITAGAEVSSYSPSRLILEMPSLRLICPALPKSSQGCPVDASRAKRRASIVARKMRCRQVPVSAAFVSDQNVTPGSPSPRNNGRANRSLDQIPFFLPVSGSATTRLNGVVRNIVRQRRSALLQTHSWAGHRCRRRRRRCETPKPASAARRCFGDLIQRVNTGFRPRLLHRMANFRSSAGRFGSGMRNREDQANCSQAGARIDASPCEVDHAASKIAHPGPPKPVKIAKLLIGTVTAYLIRRQP